MKNTTLCYIEKDNKYLMIHRSDKKNDGSQGKWMGIGGHFEEGESPYDCVIREAKEESNLTLKSPVYRGVVTFNSDKYETEQMHLFTCSEFSGEIGSCNEGELYWIDKSKVKDLDMWSGDVIFLQLIEEGRKFFSLKLNYEGERLTEYYIDNKLYKL
ncbi:MAG: 8-oxo-dGTP diphosphatase [Clostridia bacterium]|nr:8-oxo-dGTP diphosphatase [Clostridia bacterium]